MARSVQRHRNGHLPTSTPSGDIRVVTSARLVPSASDLLARFSDALSLLAVAHGSLSAKEIAGTGDEEVALRHAFDTLKSIYDELDRIPASRLRSP